jgi:Ca2+/Na+ antiporter
MLRVPLKNIIVSKGISLLVIMGSVILLMTIYLKISNGRNMLSDIMIFLFAIIMGHIISMLVMTSKIDMQQWSTLMLFAIVLVLTMVLTFTVNPPRMWIFEDNMTKSYGITQSSLDVGAYYLDKVRITSYF